jgi:hypothetical protein
MKIIQMNALGTALIVLGVASLLSGLIFMLPAPDRRKQSAQEEAFKESQERTEFYLRQMKKERREL